MNQSSGGIVTGINQDCITSESHTVVKGYNTIVETIKRWTDIRKLLRRNRRSEYLSYGISDEEKFTKIALGIIYDFGGYLTTRDEEVTLSTHHDSGVMVDLIGDFLEKRGIEKDLSADFQWERHCLRSKYNGYEE